MFITFEGPDGSGKTTQLALLAAYLEQEGWPVVRTREPGGTRIGDQVRACLHDVENTAMTAVAEILLYSASRAQLVAEVIRPNLAAGKIVLCDRYADSTLAYQGYGRGLDLTMLHTITRFATGGLQPDHTLLFDLDVSAGLTRRQIGQAEMNRMDLQALHFYERVQAGYQALAAVEPARWTIIPADRPRDVVQADVRAHIRRWLAARRPAVSA